MDGGGRGVITATDPRQRGAVSTSLVPHPSPHHCFTSAASISTPLFQRTEMCFKLGLFQESMSIDGNRKKLLCATETIKLYAVE